MQSKIHRSGVGNVFMFVKQAVFQTSVQNSECYWFDNSSVKLYSQNCWEGVGWGGEERVEGEERPVKTPKLWPWPILALNVAVLSNNISQFDICILQRKNSKRWSWWPCASVFLQTVTWSKVCCHTFCFWFIWGRYLI